MSELLGRVNAFRAAFARRQAAETVELPEYPGVFAVRDMEFALSHEHNHLVVTGPGTDPAALPGLAARWLGPRRQYAIAALEEEPGERATPVLAEAGYERSTAVVLARDTAGCELPERAARPAELAELRAVIRRQQSEWYKGEELGRQLTDRRAARLRGAERVHFLAARTPDGEVAAWVDLYLDPVAGLAQVEDLVTASPHRGAGYGDTLLATGLALAAEAGIPQLFLLADAADWPREWYGRRGFTEIGRSHSFHSR
ncbi:GNAT family N-acetyltransferase [Kitasatospora sp. SUK 42]|uniref:GNAT family N-acetyltransferase n=1 Tax=Kitasatospora sp. SUK 42 TaxID=1588882 RepID=UPI0018CB7161|nr:GNAT family N-acetyltransferase [Kitasatospora sp. SUK 42]MBV2153084.1 GNAT family N-acetyltransferase [Kitasatospora sp. SUK 42]